MRMLECLGNLRGKMQRLAPVESALLLQILLERDALDQLHDDIIEVVGMRDIVDAHNVRMRKHRNRLRLGMEPAAELLVLRQLTLENLYCHEAVEPVAARLVDNSHAARTDDLENFISIVQQRSYVLIHKIAPSLNKRHRDRHIVRCAAVFCDAQKSLAAIALAHAMRNLKEHLLIGHDVRQPIGA